MTESSSHIRNELYSTTLEIINCALHNRTIVLDKRPDWPAVYQLLRIARLAGTVYSAVSCLPPEFGPDEALARSWKSWVLERGILQMRANQELRHVLKEASKQYVPVYKI